MEYWAIINNQQTGPLTPAEIAALGITPDTMVWCNGMTRWEKARYVADFAPFLPPTFAPGDNTPPAYGYGQQPPMPSSYIVWSIISLLLCCNVAGAVALVYSLLVEYRYNNHNYEGAVRASQNAKYWNIAAIVLVILWIPIAIALGIFSSFLSYIAG